MRKGLTGATGNLYCGLLEYQDMGFLLHFLRPDDLFVDAGANTGAYTVLAAAEIGSSTISIEPIPSTFKNLLDNIAINRIQNKVTGCNVGLGSRQGKLHFTTSLDTVNHVAISTEMDTLEVEIQTLDSILESIKNPSLIKIDVEGFETEVLTGAEKTLNNDDLKAIIIELNGSGARYGYNEREIHDNLIRKGFTPHAYDPVSRRLTEMKSFGSHNTIYIRDKKYVQARVENARKVKIGPMQQAL